MATLITLPLCPLCGKRPACCGEICHSPECAPPAESHSALEGIDMAYGQGQESAIRDAVAWLYHHKAYRTAALELATQFKVPAPILPSDDRAQIHQWASDAMTDCTGPSDLRRALTRILERTKP